MFNTLASYLLGTSNTNRNRNSTEEADKNSNQEVATLDDNNVPLKTALCEDEEHDDWLLVDKEEEESLPQTDSEEELPFVEIKKSPITQRPSSSTHRRTGSGSLSNRSLSSDGISHQYFQHNLSRTSPNGMYPPSSSMEESWFVTPPPCFTSTGPVHMETSPLENLLIEHPSMSVYHSIRTMQDGDEDLVVLDLGLTETQQRPAAERSQPQTRAVRTRAERVEHVTYQQAKQGLLQRNAQKIHEKKARQILCRGALERGNKVRVFNSKNGRQRRSDMQHCKTVSRANNNRKC